MTPIILSFSKTSKKMSFGDRLVESHNDKGYISISAWNDSYKRIDYDQQVHDQSQQDHLPDVNHKLEKNGIEKSPQNRLPHKFVNSTLSLIGHNYFNRRKLANCRLVVNNPEAPFQQLIWAHDIFLSSKSEWFRRFFTLYYGGGDTSSYDFDQVTDEIGPYLVIKVPIERPEITRLEEIICWVRI